MTYAYQKPIKYQYAYGTQIQYDTDTTNSKKVGYGNINMHALLHVMYIMFIKSYHR